MALDSATKKKIYWSLLLLLLTLVVVGVGFLFITQANPRKPLKGIPSLIKRSPSKKAEVSKATCPIDGVVTTEEGAARRPLAIMIENSPAARPHSSLDKACLIMEALAEGGITRFMAIYAHNEVDEVGPVRSVRPYYLQIAQGFKALLAHVGGSRDAMSKIKAWGMADLDQFFNDEAYWRVKARPSPHNMYTSTSKLRKAAERRNYAAKEEYQGFKHKSDASFKLRPQAQSISIDFSSSAFKVKYEYDRLSNTYLRFMGGSPHTDKLTGEQLRPKNIAVIYSPTYVRRGKSGILEINLIGEGKTLVFRDGMVTSGTWQKPTLNSQILFYDETGKEIAFNPGQIWLEVVKATTSVAYQ